MFLIKLSIWFKHEFDGIRGRFEDTMLANGKCPNLLLLGSNQVRRIASVILKFKASEKR